MDGESETFVAHSLRADGFDASEDGTGRGTPLTVYPCLPANEGGTLTQIPPVDSGTGVRRLTPRECERLQGFPDDYTLITHRGKPAADGPRYKALGNSWAVPVVKWCFERMQIVDEILRGRDTTGEGVCVTHDTG